MDLCFEMIVRMCVCVCVCAQALILAMGLHEKGRSLMKKKQYDDALCHLLQADQQFRYKHNTDDIITDDIIKLTATCLVLTADIMTVVFPPLMSVCLHWSGQHV